MLNMTVSYISQIGSPLQCKLSVQLVQGLIEESFTNEPPIHVHQTRTSELTVGLTAEKQSPGRLCVNSKLESASVHISLSDVHHGMDSCRLRSCSLVSRSAWHHCP
jgi:hypothetical protein